MIWGRCPGAACIQPLLAICIVANQHNPASIRLLLRQVWNWCDPAVAVKGACFYQDTDLTRETVLLNASQCECQSVAIACDLACLSMPVDCGRPQETAGCASANCAASPRPWACCRPAALPGAGSSGDWHPASAAGQGTGSALHSWRSHQRVGARAAWVPAICGAQPLRLGPVPVRGLAQVGVL